MEGEEVNTYTYFAQSTLSRQLRRTVFRFELHTLRQNAREHMCKYSTLTEVGVIRKRETLFEPAFSVGADEMGEPTDDQVTKFGIPLVCPIHLIRQSDSQR